MTFEKLVPPKDENSILKHWIFTDKVYVSIICTCFNQESYIKDAIDGFLAQETEYRFEIIIHDDCSSDNTHNIALYYQKKYPNIIKVIQPDCNLYSSKGMNYVLKNAVIHANGEYIALCEGDDFWIDKHKLQKQIVELEKNKNISLVIHPAYKLFNDKDIELSYVHRNSKLSLHEVLEPSSEQFAPTASYFIRKEIFDRLPEWFYIAPVGDLFIEIFCGMQGEILFLSDVMSVYRINSKGSWSNSMEKDKQTYISFHEKMILSLRMIKSKIPNEYKKDLNLLIRKHLLCLSVIHSNSNRIKSFRLFYDGCLELFLFDKVLFKTLIHIILGNNKGIISIFK